MASPAFTRPVPRPLTTRVREHRALIEEIVSQVWPTLPDGADWIELAALVGSGGNPRAVSPSGGQGLLQLHEETAQELGLAHPFSPEQNLLVGVTYLHSCFDRLVDVPSDLHRLLWTFGVQAGGPRGLGFVQAALKLSREDVPESDWWRWPLGKFWLMNRKCNVSYRYPDYAFIWSFVDAIIRQFQQRH